MFSTHRKRRFLLLALPWCLAGSAAIAAAAIRSLTGDPSLTVAQTIVSPDMLVPVGIIAAIFSPAIVLAVYVGKKTRQFEEMERWQELHDRRHAKVDEETRQYQRRVDDRLLKLMVHAGIDVSDD